MSRYDELALKYEALRSRSAQADRIATELANAVGSSLAAPAGAVFAHSVSRAEGRWSMGAPGDAVSARHNDGRHYFALCIRLAAGETSPLFATLLSILAGAADTEVRLEDTTPRFSVHLDDPSARDDLVGEIIGVLEDALDPVPSGDESRPHIGFVVS